MGNEDTPWVAGMEPHPWSKQQLLEQPQHSRMKQGLGNSTSALDPIQMQWMSTQWQLMKEQSRWGRGLASNARRWDICPKITRGHHPNSFPRKKQGYKDAHTQIKAIINALNKEDQAKFYEEAQILSQVFQTLQSSSSVSSLLIWMNFFQKFSENSELSSNLSKWTFEWQYTSWKVNFRKQTEDLLAKPVPKLTVTEEKGPGECMTQTVNVLGTNYWDILISPLIKIQEQIMDEGTWINPETNSVWMSLKTNLATNMANCRKPEKGRLHW